MTELEEPHLPSGAEDVRRALAEVLDGLTRRERSSPDEERWQVLEAELGVVAEELRVQRDEVDAALEGLDRRQRLLIRGLDAASTTAALRIDADGAIRDSNVAAQHLLGRPAVTLLGKPLPVYIDLTDRTEVRDSLRKVHGTGDVVTLEVTLHGEDVRAQPCVIALSADPGGPRHGDLTPGDRRLLCLLLPLTGAQAGDRVAVTAASMARLGSLSLATGGVEEALGQVAELTLTAARGITGARFDWWGGADWHSRGAGREPSGGEWQRALGRLRAEGAPVRLPGPGDAAERSDLLCVPLVLTDDGVDGAALSLRVDPGAVTADLLPALVPFVQTAKALLADDGLLRQATLARDQLQEALLSRAVIDQAKGMVMMAMGCDADTAFAHLVQLSSVQNLKLRQVAQNLVAEARTQDR